MKGMKIAYCGVEGAFSHIATKKLFASQVLLPFSNFTEAYRAVEKVSSEEYNPEEIDNIKTILLVILNRLQGKNIKYHRSKIPSLVL